ncbi:GL26786 [Drosophila persimilis]|uniref:GL26786 n=2 Tax=Drosophila persimilis TaxID=7234 RepID=B4H2I4_DROPE|nr:GL26786 [Drosophila persimilis]
MNYSKEQLPFTVDPATEHREAALTTASNSARSYGLVSAREQRTRTYPVQERPSALPARSSRFNSYSKPPPSMDNERSTLSLFAVPTSSSNLAWRAEATAARPITKSRMPGGQEEQRMPPPVSVLSDLDFHTHSTSHNSSLSTSGGYLAPSPSRAQSEAGTAPLAVFLDNFRARNVLVLPAKSCPSSEIPTRGSGREKTKATDEQGPTQGRRWFPATPLVIPPTYNSLLEEQILQEYLPTPKCRRCRS